MPVAAACWQNLRVIPVKDHKFIFVRVPDGFPLKWFIILCFLCFCCVAQHIIDLAAMRTIILAKQQRSLSLRRPGSYKLGKIDRIQGLG